MTLLRERLPDPKTFYEAELRCQLTRPNSRGWAKGRCPKHKSKSGKSLSVNLRSGAFHCWGDGCDFAGGDLIDYVMQRDGICFVPACKKLGVWTVVTAAEQVQLDREQQQRKEEQERAEDLREKVRRERMDLREEIHSTVRILEAAAARLDQLHADGTDESAQGEQLWALLQAGCLDLRQSETDYLKLSGLEETFL
jgi:DNA primase